MVDLGDFVLNMDEDDQQDLWDRALLPFPSGRDLEGLLNYIDPENPESNRGRVRNHLSGQNDTLQLDIGYPVIELAINYSPFQTIGLNEDNIEITTVDKRERVNSTEPVLEALKMIPVSEASSVTDAVYDTVKRWRGGRIQTIPLEFWENYTEKIDDKAENLDVSSATADLVDRGRYIYGNKSIPESKVAEEVPLNQIARFGYLLSSDESLTEEETNYITDLMDSYDKTSNNPEDIEIYLLEEFLMGKGTRFGHVDEWYDILEEIGTSTREGVFVGTQDIRQILDTIDEYNLDQYGNPT